MEKEEEIDSIILTKEHAEENADSYDENDWRRLCKDGNLKDFPTSFFRRFQHELNWFWLSSNETLSEDIIKMFPDKINWIKFHLRKNISLEIIEYFEERISWVALSKNNFLGLDIIRKYQDKLDWLTITIWNKQKRMDVLEEFEHKIIWYFIPLIFCTDDFIERFHERLDFDILCCSFLISENILRKFSHKLNWHWVSIKQELSKEFMVDFQEKLSWHLIDKKKLIETHGEEFVRQFEHKWN